jgi:hypothetical protein
MSKSYTDSGPQRETLVVTASAADTYLFGRDQC